MNLEHAIRLMTVIIMGLTAGIFCCWSISVTPGLALLSDRDYILTFQKMDQAIQNIVFMFCFTAPILLLPLSTWTYHKQAHVAGFWLLLAASVIYIAVVFGITIMANVPMNEALGTFNTDNATAAEMSARRLAHEHRWNWLHDIRTIGCIACFVLTLIPAILFAHHPHQ